MLTNVDKRELDKRKPLTRREQAELVDDLSHTYVLQHPPLPPGRFTIVPSTAEMTSAPPPPTTTNASPGDEESDAIRVERFIAEEKTDDQGLNVEITNEPDTGRRRTSLR